MTSRTHFGFARLALVASLAALSLAGCKHDEEQMGHVAGWTLIDPSQRHPILVTQEPANLTVHVAAGSQGLTAGQRAQIAGFLAHYRATDTGQSKLLVSVPSGGANEVAAMRAVADLRPLIVDYGFTESSIAIEGYPSGRNRQPPIRLSYQRFVAVGPECGNWPANLGEDRRNLPYHNFGCAQQHNLAAQIANPADLLGPRSMTASDQDRRGVVYDKYRKGQTTLSDRSSEERVDTRSGQ
jgi:pilus assembly protein CpaD